MFKKLKGKRTELGYTQEQMAKMIGISTSRYVLKENGKTKFYLEEINKILSILDCKYEDIFL